MRPGRIGYKSENDKPSERHLMRRSVEEFAEKK